MNNPADAPPSDGGGSQRGDKGIIFRLENMLVKNLSVEMPDAIVAPEFNNNPNVQLELRNSSRPLSRDNYYEVLLDATVRVRSEEETQLLIEASQSGIFFVDNIGAEERHRLMNIHAAEMLYPYLSQLISDMMSRAGAPRIFLPPFNFRAVYEEKRRAMEKKLAEEGGDKT